MNSLVTGANGYMENFIKKLKLNFKIYALTRKKLIRILRMLNGLQDQLTKLEEFKNQMFWYILLRREDMQGSQVLINVMILTF